MEAITGVLKKRQVRLSDPAPLGGPGAAQAPTGQPQARLVERNDRSAIVEVRCACGRCTYVQCRWPAAAPHKET
jgi:hypothetical protein